MKTNSTTFRSNNPKSTAANKRQDGGAKQFKKDRNDYISDLSAIANNPSTKNIQRKSNPEEDELLQGKFSGSQLKSEEEEELLQGKFTPYQRQSLEEEEEPLQGKFKTLQRLSLEEDEEPLQGKFDTNDSQKRGENLASKGNNTGMPNQLKAGVEQLSGHSMDDIKVHYNSAKPAQLQAHAYAQGSEIHLAPGQEKHLPHEAWHVVQQKQGRVKPTMQMKSGVSVNDDAGLEKEADVMGAKAASVTQFVTQQAKIRAPWQTTSSTSTATAVHPSTTVQRVLAYNQTIDQIERDAITKVKVLKQGAVYKLKGAGPSYLIIKFEKFTPGLGQDQETQGMYEERHAATTALAQHVLDGVPGVTKLTDNEKVLLDGLQNGLNGGGVPDLKVAINRSNQNNSDYVGFKAELVNAGENLGDVLNPRGNAGPHPSAAAFTNMLSDTAIHKKLGKMATFDLLVGNTDRFAHDFVNIDNLDFTAVGPVGVDNINPYMGIEQAWQGKDKVKDAAARADYAEFAVKQIFNRSNVPLPQDLNLKFLVGSFAEGMKEGAAQLKTHAIAKYKAPKKGVPDFAKLEFAKRIKSMKV